MAPTLPAARGSLPPEGALARLGAARRRVDGAHAGPAAHELLRHPGAQRAELRHHAVPDGRRPDADLRRHAHRQLRPWQLLHARRAAVGALGDELVSRLGRERGAVCAGDVARRAGGGSGRRGGRVRVAAAHVRRARAVPAGRHLRPDAGHERRDALGLRARRSLCAALSWAQGLGGAVGRVFSGVATGDAGAGAAGVARPARAADAHALRPAPARGHHGPRPCWTRWASTPSR